MTNSLDGASILIVEDEVIVGLLLSNEIAHAGGRPIGPATTVAGALEKLRTHKIDAVVLDAKLADGSGADLADTLDRESIPYVVASGYDKASLPERLRAAPFVGKPIALPSLMEALASVRARSSAPRQLAESQVEVPRDVRQSADEQRATTEFPSLLGVAAR